MSVKLYTYVMVNEEFIQMVLSRLIANYKSYKVKPNTTILIINNYNYMKSISICVIYLIF
jgi:hypothetical protein